MPMESEDYRGETGKRGTLRWRKRDTGRRRVDRQMNIDI